MNMNNLALEAEQQVLGILLSTPRAWNQLGSRLTTDDFLDDLHRSVFSTMLDIRKRGGETTIITVCLALGYSEGSNREYIASMESSIISTYGFNDYVTSVADFAARRRIKSAIEQASKDIDDIEQSPAEVSGQAVKSLSSVTPSCMENIGDLMEAVKMAGEDGQRECYKTGMPRLDKVMGGGLFAGRMYGWGGRQKKGKSTVLLTLAYNLALLGVKVSYITLEMDKIEVSERLLCRKANVYASGALRGDIYPPKYIVDKLNTAKDFFRENRNISIISAPRMSLQRLQAEMSAIGYGKRAQVVIVDYLQLVSGRSRNESGADFYDTVAQTLAEMAKTHGYAVLTAVQLNREGEVRGGDGLLNACDMAFTIDSQSTQGRNGEQDIAGWMTMTVTRYTPFSDIGSKEQPAYDLNGKGPYWEERR